MQNWCYIENDGALFRGPGRGNPMEVYTADGWEPYAGRDSPRGIGWGVVIDEVEAKRLMAWIEERGRARKAEAGA